MDIVTEPDEYRIWLVLIVLALMWSYVIVSQLGI